LIGGQVGLVLVALLSAYTMHLMARTRNALGTHVKSYSELGLAAYGPLGQTLVGVFIVIGQLGIGIAYLIFNGT